MAPSNRSKVNQALVLTIREFTDEHGHIASYTTEEGGKWVWPKLGVLSAQDMCRMNVIRSVDETRFDVAAACKVLEAQHASGPDLRVKRVRKPRAKKSGETGVRIELLETAIDLTGGDRNKQYGDPRLNHQGIASIFNAINPRSLQLTARDIAMVHVATKLHRLKSDPTHLDSAADLMAYVGIATECYKG